jgi:hypothetical protein
MDTTASGSWMNCKSGAWYQITLRLQIRTRGLTESGSGFREIRERLQGKISVLGQDRSQVVLARYSSWIQSARHGDKNFVDFAEFVTAKLWRNPILVKLFMLDETFEQRRSAKPNN